ncbi:MAG: hypothetical protein CME21_20620 [Gemmatimonadetes bacterium]|nr:hypothetical protein [Gemmatimonadota bacterium]
MHVSELKTREARLSHELQETRDQLAKVVDPEAYGTELARSRAYAFSASSPIDEVVAGCADSVDRNGFCVIDNVIPPEEVDSIREEAVEVGKRDSRNIDRIRQRLEKGSSPEDLLNETGPDAVELRQVRKRGCPPKPPNDIVWMPKYAQHLAHPAVTAVARHVLDDHVRIAQLHSRHLPVDGKHGGPVSKHRGDPETREWHTDWPHDLSAYGGNDQYANAGCIRQPFPDLTMCIVMIWYLTDVDENSGGTWIVPGSHKDERNPRGPNDDMVVSAPIPGDMQVSAPAGSVYMQDSRCWHASAMHNPSGRDRVAVVNRWCPWWLSVDDFAPGDGVNTNTVCRPISHEEYKALPPDARPLFRHVCPDERDTLQEPVLDRAQAAQERNNFGWQQFEQNRASLKDANAHVRVASMHFSR